MTTNHKQPKISIVVPSYNQGEFIWQTLVSIFQQSYQNLEVIVMDGGSNDTTVSILKWFKKKFPKSFYWKSEKDRGQTHAINKGVAKASGEIVGYLNSDDILAPESLSLIANYFEKQSVQWLTGDYTIIDAQNRPMQSFVASYKRWLRRFHHPALLSIANYIIQPGTFWRASLGKKAGDFDESLHYCMDFDMWFRFQKFSPPTIAPTTLAYFRIHESSKGGSQYLAQFEEEGQVAARYTKNPFILLLHQLHARLVTMAYNVIK